MCNCNCKCSCDSEINVNTPEEYEIFSHALKRWCQVVDIFDTGSLDNHIRYGVRFKSSASDHGFSHAWVGKELLRKKPKWEPEVGKVYLFSDYEEKVGTTVGQAGILNFVDNKLMLPYRVENGTYWTYCWPFPDLELLGK